MAQEVVQCGIMFNVVEGNIKMSVVANSASESLLSNTLKLILEGVCKLEEASQTFSDYRYLPDAVVGPILEEMEIEISNLVEAMEGQGLMLLRRKVGFIGKVLVGNCWFVAPTAIR